MTARGGGGGSLHLELVRVCEIVASCKDATAVAKAVATAAPPTDDKVKSCL